MKGKSYIKGAPLKAGGGHNSTMMKENGSNKLKEPGQNKYGSNTMSPCAKEGRVNTYGQ
jgi:hypothetical protein